MFTKNDLVYMLGSIDRSNIIDFVGNVPSKCRGPPGNIFENCFQEMSYAGTVNLYSSKYCTSFTVVFINQKTSSTA